MKYRDAVDKLQVPQALKDKTLAAMTADSRRPGRPRLLTATAVIALVAAAALFFQLLTGGSILGQRVQALAVAQYPSVGPRPTQEEFTDPHTGQLDDQGYWNACQDWYNRYYDVIAPYHYREGADGRYLASLTDFSHAALARALGETGGENTVYSPANVYLALALLTELTDGESRRQILDALGVDDMALLRDQTERLWRQLYYDDQYQTAHLANSLWLDQDATFRQDTLDFLAEHYFASSYRGQMGSQALDQALKDWLNAQTGGLLSRQIESGVGTTPQTVLVLASTLYYQGQWRAEFDPALTRPGEFQNADGTTSSVEFMHHTLHQNYLWSDRFSAISLGLGEHTEMVLILPDEGVTPEALLRDEKALDVLTSRSAIGSERWEENTAWVELELSMPKFDVSSTLQLIPQLQSLGISAVFTPEADFTPLTDTRAVAVTDVTHAARVRVDEEGCTASSFVAMLTGGIPPLPDETVYFTLDRPFLFAITGAEGLPLFVGVVNQL